MQSWNFSQSTYIDSTQHHHVSTSSLHKDDADDADWSLSGSSIIIKINQHHHYQWWCLHLCVFQLLWGYYNDVILSLRITVLLGLHSHVIRVPHHGLSTAILMEFNHRYFIIQECLLICKLSSLLPLLLIYPLLHDIRNDHLHGNQLDFLIGDDLPCEPMRLSAYTRDC